jgi:hypothetical protein
MTGTLAIIRVGSAASGMDLDAFAAACGLHPELVRRFAALGLVEPGTDSSGHRKSRRKPCMTHRPRRCDSGTAK